MKDVHELRNQTGERSRSCRTAQKGRKRQRADTFPVRTIQISRITWTNAYSATCRNVQSAVGFILLFLQTFVPLFPASMIFYSTLTNSFPPQCLYPIYSQSIRYFLFALHVTGSCDIAKNYANLLKSEIMKLMKFINICIFDINNFRREIYLFYSNAFMFPEWYLGHLTTVFQKHVTQRLIKSKKIICDGVRMCNDVKRDI